MIISDDGWKAITGIAIALITATQPIIAYLILKQSKNIQKIETATNSMKDALIVATEKEALARGQKTGEQLEKDRNYQQQQQQQPPPLPPPT